METILIRKYFPNMKVIRRVNCKSLTQIAKECGMNAGHLSNLSNGKSYFDEDNPKHVKAMTMLAERSKLIEDAMEEMKDDYIRVDNIVYKKNEYGELSKVKGS